MNYNHASMPFLKVVFLFILILSLSFLLPVTSYSQTTGKIAGKIIDAESGEPLPGVNVQIEKSRFGAATDLNGEFFIINLPPGVYTVTSKMMGYETIRLQNLTVSINRTTTANFKLKATVLAGQEITVSAERISMKKDQTSSIRNVSANQIKELPAENIDAVVSMQAGVVAGHFRGGRLGEVSYLIDGLQVDEAFSRNRSVTIEKEVISEIEVITGTFNAEYGNAMSGIVNVVTRDGTDKLHGSVASNFANYYTQHKDIFIGLKDNDFFRTQDYRLSLEGPILKERLNFLINWRYQDVQEHLNGIRRFQPDNYSDFTASDTAQWYSEHTGDDAIMPMITSQPFSFFGKLSFKPWSDVRTSLAYSLNRVQGKWYEHYMKYNPEGRPGYHEKSDLVTFQLNHGITRALFYEARVSYMSSFNGNYLFAEPTDSRYIHDEYYRSKSPGPGFSTGGQAKNYLKRTTNDLTARYDLTWQMNKQHIFKSGLVLTQHAIEQFQTTIRNEFYGKPNELESVRDSVTQKIIFLNYRPMVLDPAVFTDNYQVRPREFAAYLQDKMEYEDMVINLGLRYDYFDPNTRYPSQWRNPSNQLNFPNNPEYMSTYPKARANSQLSPRFGISYKVGKAALARFSYGHFFQMPPLYALYTNYNFLIPPDDFGTTLGNPQINPQKTIQYEVGLWQQLEENMSLEVVVFYRDIYDLLSSKIMTTFNQIRYGLYSNKDYGNVKGLELKFEYATGPVSAMLNYTLQYTRGNADNPTFSFDRAGENKDPVNILIPMSWDQRHTLNGAVGYNQTRFGATLMAYYNSGTPYSWTPLSESALYRINLFPNNTPKPSQISVDLTAFYSIWTAGTFNLKLTLLGYNLLDTLNESWVYSRTGRAYADIVRESDLVSHHSNFNDYYDVIQNPAMYNAPRSLKVGLEVTF